LPYWCRLHQLAGLLSRLAQHLGTEILFGVLEPHSFAIVAPSLQTMGRQPSGSARTSTSGPSVMRTASDSWLAPRKIFSRAAARNSTCVWAMAISHPG
jgi:hypothetical protein